MCDCSVHHFHQGASHIGCETRVFFLLHVVSNHVVTHIAPVKGFIAARLFRPHVGTLKI